MSIEIKVYGEGDARAVEQLQRCADHGEAVGAALMADHHVGYSQPIGGVVAYENFISPSGVGYDIACGNKAVKTNLRVDDIVRAGNRGLPAGTRAGSLNVLPTGKAGDGGSPPEDRADREPKNEASPHAYPDSRSESAIAQIMDEIASRISFGMGRVNDEPVDHPVFDAIREADFTPQRQLIDKAVNQLGTVGSGNHYVDLFEDEEGWLWIGVHFGSRGFGHKTASGFLSLAAGGKFEEAGNDGEMDSPPVLLDVSTDLGQSYIAAMELAGEYAYAGRDVVCDKVLEILGAESIYEVHNHHNFAWRENHRGVDCWVIRKGATPAFPGQEGFVGATMGEDSVILAGRESAHSEDSLCSTVHGAGRVMSRTQAAGKSRKRWACNNRDCDWHQGKGEHKPEDGNCPKCGHEKLAKRMVQLTPGEIDWQGAQADVAARGIELRGAGADEAPGAYKRLPDVLAAHGDQIEVLHTLRPIGVAMAGPDTYDPYKD